MYTNTLIDVDLKYNSNYLQHDFPHLLHIYVILYFLYSFNNPQQMIPIVITLETEEGGSEELLGEVQKEIQLAEEELDVNFAVDTVDRFGTCIKYMHAYCIHTCINNFTLLSTSVVLVYMTILTNFSYSCIMPIVYHSFSCSYSKTILGLLKRF